MRTPYEPASPPITDPETVRQWRAYEAQGGLARLQYQRFPSILYHGGVSQLCQCLCGCIKRTTALAGVCQKCARGEA